MAQLITETGHKNDFEHVATCLEHVLPRLLSERTRVHVIGIGTGCESVLKVLDARISENGEALKNDIASIALVEPTHDHRMLRSTALKSLLRTNGRSWVQSEMQQNELLYTPEPISVSAAQGATSGKADIAALEFECGMMATSADSKSPDAVTNEHESVQGEADIRYTASDRPLSSTPPNEEQEYNYEQEPVSCPTYSAGISGVPVELVFPHNQKDVLAYICERVALPHAVREA